MKVRMKSVSIAAAAVMLSTAALAQAQAQTSPVYGEIGYTMLKIKSEDVGTVHPGALRGIVGYAFHPNLAVEGMLAFGVVSDNVDVSGVNVKVKLDNAYGIYLKPKYDVTPQVELFGRLGYTKVK